MANDQYTTFGDLSRQSGDAGRTVADWISNGHASLEVLTDATGGSIPHVLTLHTPAASDFVHEVMHIYTKLNDKDLAFALGIRDTSKWNVNGKFSSSGEASVAIGEFLESNCDPAKLKQ